MIIIKALSHVYWSKLHGFCFIAPTYLEPNPWMDCTSSNSSLLLKLMFTLAFIYFFKIFQPEKRRFSFIINAFACLCWTCPNHCKLVSLNLSSIESPVNALEYVHLFLHLCFIVYATSISTFSYTDCSHILMSLLATILPQ